MDDLTKIKKRLKKWETSFCDEFKRKPDRADIDQAPAEIQDAYKQYKELKQTPKPTNNDAKENTDSTNISKVDNTETDTNKPENTEAEVWGHEFDKKNEKADKNKITPNTNTKQSSFLQNLGKKMFEKSLKLNIHQVGTQKTKQWRKPDTPRRGLGPNPFSVPTESISKIEDVIEENEHPNELGSNESSVAETDPTDSDIPVIQLKNVKNFVCKTSTFTGSNKHNATESDPCLGKFQTKSKHGASFLPKNLSKLVSKHKKQYADSFEADIVEENMEVDNEHNVDAADEHKVDDNDEQSGHSWHVPVKDLIIEDMVKCDKKKHVTKSNVENKSGRGESDTVETHWKKGGRAGAGLKTNVKDSKVDCDKKNYENVNEANDHYSYPSDTDEPVIAKGRRKVTRKRKQISSDDNDDDYNDGGKKEDSSPDTKQRKGTVKKKSKASNVKPAAKKQKSNTGEPLPLNDDDNQVDADGSSSTTKLVPKKPTRTKALSNDNFLRLNMKVKTYKRKGRHMTGQQHRRQMWKQKMKDRSKSYGDACFKCGQPGHWANKCPGGGYQNAMKKEPVEDEDFPSMQEAAMMAKGIRLEQTTNKVKRETNTPKANVDKDVTPDNATAEQVDEVDVDLEIQSEIVRSRKDVEPVYSAMEPLLDEDQSTDEVPDFVQKGLKKFGYDSFRPGQREAVMRILKGQSTLVVLSTGGGKSLCYQLPAYLYAQRKSCITLVISPLVSLMEDQVTGLPNGVRGVCLHTNMTASQRESVLSAVKDGKAQFLLVSPEAIAGGSMTLISSMSTLPPVAFVCIDEAHCLSEWSHNFRPSYLRLCKVLREKLGIQCFLGLTATATLSTAADVSRHLNITDFKTATVRGSPIPHNLQLSVSRDENREQALINLLQGDRFGSLDSIIIYCTRRDQTEKVASIIRTCLNKGAPVEAKKGKKKPNLEWDAESYHAGLSPAQRKRVQNSFMSGKLRVVVATVAFGMGLDKADVRGIIHYNMPKSFESYVQEIGRAGRDGNTAQCHVFLDAEGKDLCELRRHTYANTVDYRTLKKLVTKIFAPCRCREVHEKHARASEEVTRGTLKHQEGDFDDADDADLIGACDDEPVTDNGEQSKEHQDTSLENKAKPDNESKGAEINENLQSDTKDTDNSTSERTNMSLKDPDDQVDKESGGGEDDYSDTVENNKSEPNVSKDRLCPGHERALPIEQTVMELDVKEEGISTLLCYMELHSSQWLENLPSVYANCKIQCYGGPSQLQAVAKKCPPVAVAVAKAKKDGKTFSNTNIIEFPVVEISDCMGWDSGPVKKELKLLQWDFSSGTAPKRTGVMIEFTDLSYHFRSPGDFTTSELDDILEFLHARVQRQEKSEIYNLSKLYKSLKSVSHKNYWMCADSLDMTKNDKLKAILNEYFDTQSQTVEEEENAMETLQSEPAPEYSRSQVMSDIHQFIGLYSQEHALTGRAIARIFHGISSPCFPAKTWGRVRRFWRSHLNVDFNELMKTATRELIMLRR